MNVLSLLDGISCGRVALERAGIPVTNYFACEIDKYAIQVSKKNYPDIIQLGDVCKIQSWMLPKIDMLIGGSPCFPAGTRVATSEGHKDISEIDVGDLVLTHKGSYKPVIATGGATKDTFMIKAQGFLPTEATQEHPYYVREKYKIWNNAKRRYVRAFKPPRVEESKRTN